MSFHAEVSEMPSVLSTLEIRHANAACIIETVKLEVESAVIVIVPVKLHLEVLFHETKDSCLRQGPPFLFLGCLHAAFSNRALVPGASTEAAPPAWPHVVLTSC